MTKLMIIRGLPGSGKSTLAKKVFDANCLYDVIYEADMYFMNGNKYEFDLSKLGRAHKWCHDKAFEALHYEYNTIVANTFTTMKELKPYLQFIDVFPELQIIVVDMVSQFKSMHDLPEDTITKMKGRWQYLSKEWLDKGVLYVTSSYIEKTLVKD